MPGMTHGRCRWASLRQPKGTATEARRPEMQASGNRGEERNHPNSSTVPELEPAQPASRWVVLRQIYRQRCSCSASAPAAEVGGICCRGRFSQRFSFNNMWGQACMGTRRLLRAREFVIALQGGSLECQSVSQKYSRLVITRVFTSVTLTCLLASQPVSVAIIVPTRSPFFEN